jgi:uridine kinase
MQCLADLKACKQTNIPIYSFKEHQRLDEKKYLYGAAIILGARIFICLDTANLTANTIVEGIMALNDPTLRALYDLKVCRDDWMKLLVTNLLLCERYLCSATQISCCPGE